MQRYRPVMVGVLLFLITQLLGCAALNNYQIGGQLQLTGLKQPVEVIRDEKGMAYIRAGNLDDAVKAQGFVTAQDRLFQMEMIRRAAQGRISEILGAKTKSFDVRMRTFGFHRNARKHAQILDEETRRYFENYIMGVNAYIYKQRKTRSLELKLAGIELAPWAVTDVLAIIYYKLSQNKD